MKTLRVFTCVVMAWLPVACGSARNTNEDARFPEAGVDHLRLAVELEFEIFGIGKDKLRLEGDILVHRGGPGGPGGTIMKGDLAGASLQGESEKFGKVVAIESPLKHSPCEYEWKGKNSYQGQFNINAWFLLPEHNLVVFSKKPIQIMGPATAIPPVGQVATGTNLPVGLYDFNKPDAQPIGTVSSAQGNIPEAISFHMIQMDEETTVSAMRK